MLRLFFAACLIASPTVAMAQPGNMVPTFLPPASPHPEIPPSPVHAWLGPDKVVGPKSVRIGPNLVRMINVDRKNNVIFDYLVMTERPAKGLSFTDTLQHCVDAGSKSELLLNSSVPSSGMTRVMKLVTCSDTALGSQDRIANLERAQRYYESNGVIDRREDRRAVQAVFAKTIGALRTGA